MAAELRPCDGCSAAGSGELLALVDAGLLANRASVVRLRTGPAEEADLCVPCAHLYTACLRAVGDPLPRWRWLTTVVTPPPHDCRDTPVLVQTEVGHYGYDCARCGRAIGVGRWGS